MFRKLTLALVLCLPASARADEKAARPSPQEVGEARPAEGDKPADALKPHRSPRRMGTAMKPVVCRSIEEAKGKTGQDLASAIEQVATQFHHANYRLSALLHADPPIACFHSLSDPSKLPMGAK